MSWGLFLSSIKWSETRNMYSTYIREYQEFIRGMNDIFRENMDMEKLSFDNIDILKLNRQIERENRFNWKQNEKVKQTTLSDFII